MAGSAPRFDRLLPRLLVLVCLILPACAGAPADRTAPWDHRAALVYDPARVARADKLAIFVPGALTSVRMFAPARGWVSTGYAPVYYRFPGLDGRPLDGVLDLEKAATRIAAFAQSHPDKDIALIGYSSGAPIAILAAARIDDGRQIPVAAISPAVERAGGLPTLARGFGDILRAASRAGSLNQLDIWIEYWQILLYGRASKPDPVFRERIVRQAQTHRGDRPLGPPDPELARAHARQLRFWEIPQGLDLGHVDLRIFTGAEDPVFSLRQTWGFARQLGQERLYVYPGEGHLLYLTQPDVFLTEQRFADESLARTGTR